MITLYSQELGKEIPHERMIFSGGEVHVRLTERLPINSTIKVLAVMQNANDIMELLLLNDAIKRFYPTSERVLIIPYLPYARQDRVCNTGEALGVKVMCDLINSMEFSRINVMDCHSDVGVALLNNASNIDQYYLFEETFDNLVSASSIEDLVLVSPDAGANKKTFKVAQSSGIKTVIRADKTRDVATGNITGTVVYADDLSGKICVICDDICDGGKTFIELAKELRKKGAASVVLVVTHGIFSKGFDELFSAGINHIYTKHNWNEEHPYVSQV